MSKIFYLFPIVLMALLVFGLSPITVSSNNASPTTCSIDYRAQMVSAECELASDNIWPADETPHFIIWKTLCCGAGPCWHSCNTDQLTVREANQFTLKTAGGITVSTSFTDSHIHCYDQPLINFSQTLTPSLYTLDFAKFGGNLNFDFQVITNSVSLDPLPQPTPTPSPGKIVGRIWRDMDEDGIQDDNEPGVAGVNIGLVDVCWADSPGSRGYPEREYDNIDSDDQGFFEFTDVNRIMANYSHDYVLRFDSEYVYTKPNQGEDDMQDSDTINFCADSYQCLNSATHGFRLPITGTLRGIDAGIIPEKLFLPVIRSDRAISQTVFR